MSNFKKDDEYKFLFLLFKNQVRNFIDIAFIPGLESRERLEQVFLSPKDELEYQISNKLLHICLNMTNTEKDIFDENKFKPFESKCSEYIVAYIYMMYKYSQLPEVKQTLTGTYDFKDVKELEKFNDKTNIIFSSLSVSTDYLLHNIGIESDDDLNKICSEANLIWIYYFDELLEYIKSNVYVGPILYYGNILNDDLTGDLLASAIETLTYKEQLIVEGKKEDIIKKENEQILKFLNYFDLYMLGLKKKKFGD